MLKRFILLLALALSPVLTGCSLHAGTGLNDAHGKASIEERWGIKVEGLRLSAEGFMCDFRFRIVDGQKAAPLLDRRNAAALLNEETGLLTYVPVMPKVGPLRQTVRLGKPTEGRTYFIFFANPGKLIKPGSTATVSIGDFVMTGLVVQ